MGPLRQNLSQRFDCLGLDHRSERIRVSADIGYQADDLTPRNADKAY